MSSVGEILFLIAWIAAGTALIVPSSARRIVALSKRQVAKTEQDLQGQPKWIQVATRNQQGEALTTVPQSQRWGAFMVIVGLAYAAARLT